MSGYTRRERDRGWRIMGQIEALGVELSPRFRERVARILAAEFGAMRRGMILALRNEVDRQVLKLPPATPHKSVANPRNDSERNEG